MKIMEQHFYSAFNTGRVSSTGAAIYDVDMHEMVRVATKGFYEVDRAVNDMVVGDDSIGDVFESYAQFVILNAAGKLDVDRAAADAHFAAAEAQRDDSNEPDYE